MDDPTPPPSAPPPGGATWNEAPRLVGSGACMGMAEVIPGVSGGTIALLMGVYVRLVEAIKSFDTGLLRLLRERRWAEARDRTAWRFLLLLGSGQAAGIILFNNVLKVPLLIDSHPEAIYGLFFGLVLASAILLGRDAWRAGGGVDLVVAAILGTGVGFGVASAARHATPLEPWFVAISGVLAICAMLLPGISGSFVLLLMHQYGHVMGGVRELVHPAEGGGLGPRLVALRDIVGPFALGCGVGVIGCSRLLSWLLARAFRLTLGFMTGLLVGSLWMVWPFQRRLYEAVGGKRVFVRSEGHHLPSWDGTSALSLALLVGGLVLVLGLERATRRSPQARLHAD